MVNFFCQEKKLEKYFLKITILLVIFFLHANEPDEKEATECFTEGGITALESEGIALPPVPELPTRLGVGLGPILLDRNL